LKTWFKWHHTNVRFDLITDNNGSKLLQLPSVLTTVPFQNYYTIGWYPKTDLLL